MRTTTTKMTTMILAAVVGTAVGVPTATAGDGDRTKAMANNAYGLQFRTTSDVIGSPFLNLYGEEIGTTSDMIVDRGSGEIRYVVVRTGDVMGWGGRELAIPADKIEFNAEKDSYTLPVAMSNLEPRARHGEREWLELESGTWEDKLSNNPRIDTYAHRTSDDPFEKAYRNALGESKVTSNHEGKVTGVSTRTIDKTEFVTIELRTKNTDKDMTIVLGPAWFVRGSESMPQIGDMVTVAAMDLRTYGHPLIASTLTNSSENMFAAYRTKKGAAAWTYEGQLQRKRADRMPASPYVLLSSVAKSEAIGRNAQNFGETQGAIIEGQSGRVAMLMLDPNTNFLGMNDDLIAVPWSTFSVLDNGKVMVNANKDRVKRTPPVPSDLEKIHSYDRFDGIYSNYGVHSSTITKSNDFASRDDIEWSGWGDNSAYCNAIRDGEPVAITGTFQGLTRVWSEEVQTAIAAAMIVTDSSGVKFVQLGPDWFVDADEIGFEKGDRVSVNARKIRLDGEKVLFGTSIRSTKSRDAAFASWHQNGPAWINF